MDKYTTHPLVNNICITMQLESIDIITYIYTTTGVDTQEHTSIQEYMIHVTHTHAYKRAHAHTCTNKCMHAFKHTNKHTQT